MWFLQELVERAENVLFLSRCAKLSHSDSVSSKLGWTYGGHIAHTSPGPRYGGEGTVKPVY